MIDLKNLRQYILADTIYLSGLNLSYKDLELVIVAIRLNHEFKNKIKVLIISNNRLESLPNMSKCNFTTIDANDNQIKTAPSKDMLPSTLENLWLANNPCTKKRTRDSEDSKLTLEQIDNSLTKKALKFIDRKQQQRVSLEYYLECAIEKLASRKEYEFCTQTIKTIKTYEKTVLKELLHAITLIDNPNQHIIYEITNNLSTSLYTANNIKLPKITKPTL